MNMTVNDGIDLSAVRYVALCSRNEGGDFESAIGHHGHDVSVDYRTAVGMGNVEGHSLFRGFGYRTGLSTAVNGDDIWQGTATTLPFPDQSVGEQMTFVSTSAADSAAGANIRTLHHHYLDSNGNEQVEVITMNGVTPVNTVATNIRFSQYIHSNSVGAFGAVAAGDISVYRTGDAARVYNVIKAGGNISLNSMRMVPLNKKFFVDYISVTGASGKPLSVRLRATNDDEGILTSGIFLFNEIFSIQDSAAIVILSVPRKFPALSIVKATAFSSQAGGECTISYGGWLETE